MANKVPAVGRLSLSPMLNEKGRVIGDFTISRYAEDKFLLVCSLAAESYYLRWFERHMPADGVIARGAPSAVGEDERRFLERGGANDAAIYVARRAEPLQERQHSGARWWHRHLLPARHLVRPLHWTRTTPPPPAPPPPPPLPPPASPPLTPSPRTAGGHGPASAGPVRPQPGGCGRGSCAAEKGRAAAGYQSGGGDRALG